MSGGCSTCALVTSLALDDVELHPFHDVHGGFQAPMPDASSLAQSRRIG